MHSIQNDYTVKIVSRTEDIQFLRSSWEKLLNHPSADIDYFLMEIQERPEMMKPHIIQVLFKGRLETMLIGRVEKRKIPIRISHCTIARPTARLFLVPYGGILGKESVGLSEVLFTHLSDCLKSGKVDMIQINGVDQDSSLYQLSRSLPNFLCRSVTPLNKPYYRVSLPHNLEEFLRVKSPKNRRRLIRYMRKIERHPHEYRLFLDEMDVKRLCEDTENIAGTTYQRALSGGFFYNKETERKFNLWANKGWLRGYILYLNHKPVSFWIGAHLKDRFFLDSTGFNPYFSNWKPGKVLFLKMIEDLCNIKVKVVEYGFGTYTWKKRFSDEKYEMTSVVVYAASLRGLRLKLLQDGTTILSYALKKVLDKANLMSRVRNFRLLRQGYRTP